MNSLSRLDVGMRTLTVTERDGVLGVDVPEEYQQLSYENALALAPDGGRSYVVHTSPASDPNFDLTYTWYNLSPRDADWMCAERGYLVSRLVISNRYEKTVGYINVTHTTRDLLFNRFPSVFHWADENLGYSFGFKYYDFVPLSKIWSAAYRNIGVKPPSMRSAPWRWGVDESDAPRDKTVLFSEMEYAEREILQKFTKFESFLMIPFVDFIQLDEHLRGTGISATLYSLAAKELAKQGKVLRASGLQTDAAKRAWLRMAADPAFPTRTVRAESWRPSSDAQEYHHCLDYTGA